VTARGTAAPAPHRAGAPGARRANNGPHGRWRSYARAAACGEALEAEEHRRRLYRRDGAQ